MENNSAILSEGYGFRLLTSTRCRTGLVCKTDKGFKELKKIYYDEKTVRFEDAVKRHLKQRGFDKVRPFILTLDGTPFFNYDDTTYVLEDYAPTVSADLTEKETMKKAVFALADMHTASESFDTDVEKIYGADLKGLYEKREIELMRIVKRIKNGKSIKKADRLVIDNSGKFAERAKKAIEILNDCGYGESEQKVICHNCYKGENIKLSEKGEIVVSGFSKCAIDREECDIAEFIRRYFKDNLCSAESAFEIVDIYGEKRPLDKEKIKIIYAMLLYPSKFFRLCNKYYNKRRSFISPAVEEKFDRCCQMAEREEKFLAELSLRMLN